MNEEKEYEYTSDCMRLPEEFRAEYDTVEDLLADFELDAVIDRVNRVLLSYDDEDTGLFRLQRAVAFKFKGEDEEALELLEELTNEAVIASRAWLEIAKIYSDAEDYIRSENALSCVTIAPDTVNPWHFIKADNAMDTDGFEEAREILLEGMDKVLVLKETGSTSDNMDFMGIALELLKQDVMADAQEYLAEDNARVMEFLKTYQPSWVENEAISERLSSYSTYANENIWARPHFTALIKALDENGWCADYQELLQSGYASTQSFEAYEDDELSPILYEYLTAHEFTASGNESALSDNELSYFAARLYRENPQAIAYAEEKYLDFCGNKLDAIKADPERIEQQARAELLKEERFHHDENRLDDYLNRSYEYFVHMRDMHWRAGLSLPLYPGFVGNVVAALHVNMDNGNFDHVLTNAEHVDAKQDPGLRIQYATAIAETTEGSIRAASRIVKTMEKNGPNSTLTAIARANLYLTDQKWERALRTLQRVAKPEEELISFAELYFAALHALGKDEKVRPMIYRLMEQVNANPPFEVRDQVFPYIGWLIASRADVIHGDEKFLAEDLAQLKQLIEKEGMKQQTEGRFACHFSQFCTEALESEWGEKYFQDLVKFCEEHFVFIEQDAMIPSAWSAIESYRAHRDPKFSRALFNLITSMKELRQGDIRFEYVSDIYVNSWLVAHELKEHPENYDYIVNNYPVYVEDVRDLLDRCSENPDGIMEDSEKVLSEHYQMTREETRKELMKMRPHFD